MIILGIDPGYGIVGFGVIEKTSFGVKVIDYGAIYTYKQDAFPERLRKQAFVVSDIKEEDNDGVEYANSKIKVIHHPGHFCERCWNYENDAILQEDGTYLCKRCSEVVK